VPAPIGSIRNASSPGGARQSESAPREQAAGRLEHEELPRRARVELAALETEQRVEPDRLGTLHTHELALGMDDRFHRDPFLQRE